MSGTTTLYPASARAGIWWRHEYDVSGKPCTSMTSGPSPAVVICSSASLGLTRSMDISGLVILFFFQIVADDYGGVHSVITSFL